MIPVPSSILHFYKSKFTIKVNLKFQTQNLLAVPKFKTALAYRDRFTFGYEKLDWILDLHLEDTIGSLVVRSLLPRNHGGVDAENVMVIDANNSSSPYLYVYIARVRNASSWRVTQGASYQTIHDISID